MDEARKTYLDIIVDRLVNLSTAERTTALTHLYSLRTAAVEDLSDLDDNRQHWDTVLESSTRPGEVQALVRELIQLADNELDIIGIRVSERSNLAHEQILSSADEEGRAKFQAKLAASTKQ